MATLHLGWSHHYNNFTVVRTNWFTITKYLYLKWQWIFSVLCIFFSFLYYQKDDYIGRCLIRSKHGLPFENTWVRQTVFDEMRVAHLLSFLFCICFSYLRSVSCVPENVCVSALSILDCPLGFRERLFVMSWDIYWKWRAYVTCEYAVYLYTTFNVDWIWWLSVWSH